MPTYLQKLPVTQGRLDTAGKVTIIRNPKMSDTATDRCLNEATFLNVILDDTSRSATYLQKLPVTQGSLDTAEKVTIIRNSKMSGTATDRCLNEAPFLNVILDDTSRSAKTNLNPPPP